VRQTILSVVVEVQPESADLLRKRIQALKDQEEDVRGPAVKYDRLRSAVPALHFMSLTVFRDDLYDPVFVLEANFDGEPGPFWAQIEAAIGAPLREMLRCCKPPRDETAALFDAVTRPDSRVPLAPFLEARTVRPLVSHQGNRNLDRARILQEGKLFASVQKELNGGHYQNTPAPDLQQRLRAALLPHYPWLGAPIAPRFGAAEHLADLVRFIAFLLVVLVVLAAPWWGLVFVASRLTEYWPAWLTWPRPWLAIPLALLLVALAAALSVFAVILPWLHWLERRDPSHEAPAIDENAMREMARHEDQIAQNHMISLVQIKPGVLRAVLLRVGLPALGLYLRANARNGYLQTMRTIHFAHWALVSNGGRLMFHSNFDGSWESYLDDFIEKAHGGLTFAWTSGVGFPPTTNMFQQGATNGRVFKAWGRHSMVESLFWFSAYREYSVNQIERQARIANGLCQPALTEQEAATWAMDL
jgi:hypothetical protein